MYFWEKKIIHLRNARNITCKIDPSYHTHLRNVIRKRLVIDAV